MWREFRRVLAKNRGQLRRPARSEQNPAKKFSFPFRRKNPARAKSEMQRKLFCWVASVSERRRGGFLSSVQKMFERSCIIPPISNFPIFARPIRPREARKGMETLARPAQRGSPSAGSKSLAILSICFAQ